VFGASIGAYDAPYIVARVGVRWDPAEALHSYLAGVIAGKCQADVASKKTDGTSALDVATT
jgi:hypothetical protein